MAILGTPVRSGKCPKCASKDVEIKYKKIDSNKSSTITRKWIKCNSCGYEGSLF